MAYVRVRIYCTRSQFTIFQVIVTRSCADLNELHRNNLSHYSIRPRIRTLFYSISNFDRAEGVCLDRRGRPPRRRTYRDPLSLSSVGNMENGNRCQLLWKLSRVQPLPIQGESIRCQFSRFTHSHFLSDSFLFVRKIRTNQIFFFGVLESTLSTARFFISQDAYYDLQPAERLSIVRCPIKGRNFMTQTCRPNTHLWDILLMIIRSIHNTSINLL